MSGDEQDRWDAVCDDVHGDLAARLSAHDGSLLTKYLTIAEVIGDDGTRALFSLCSNGTKSWETLGMLEFARQAEQAGANEDDP